MIFARPDTTALKRIAWKVDLHVYLNRSIRVQNWAMSKSKLEIVVLEFLRVLVTPASSRLNIEKTRDRNLALSTSVASV